MSAPASVTFLNAMQLERRTLYSLGALLVILAAMPIGAQLGRRLPHRWFDNLIMCLLASIALKIILDALLT